MHNIGGRLSGTYVQEYHSVLSVTGDDTRAFRGDCSDTPRSDADASDGQEDRDDPGTSAHGTPLEKALPKTRRSLLTDGSGHGQAYTLSSARNKYTVLCGQPKPCSPDNRAPRRGAPPLTGPAPPGTPPGTPPGDQSAVGVWACR